MEKNRPTKTEKNCPTSKLSKYKGQKENREKRKRWDYSRCRMSKQLRCGHGKYRGARHYLQTKPSDYDLWRKKKANRRQDYTSKTLAAVHALSSKSASSRFRFFMQSNCNWLPSSFTSAIKLRLAAARMEGREKPYDQLVDLPLWNLSPFISSSLIWAGPY